MAEAVNEDIQPSPDFPQDWAGMTVSAAANGAVCSLAWLQWWFPYKQVANCYKWCVKWEQIIQGGGLRKTKLKAGTGVCVQIAAFSVDWESEEEARDWSNQTDWRGERMVGSVEKMNGRWYCCAILRTEGKKRDDRECTGARWFCYVLFLEPQKVRL